MDCNGTIVHAIATFVYVPGILCIIFLYCQCQQIKIYNMPRLKALDPESTSGKSKELFNAIQIKLGMVPNMMRTMGNSSAVLQGYW